MKNKLPPKPKFVTKLTKHLHTDRAAIKKKQEMKKKVAEIKMKEKARKERKEAEILSVPRSLIIGRGKLLPREHRDLVFDLRRLMLPYTALKFEKHPSTSWKILKDVCGSMVITHLMSVKPGIGGTELNIGRLPHGPTLQFSVTSFCTCKDLAQFFKAQGNKFMETFPTQHSPLVVLNNFTQAADEKTAATVKLMAVTLQNMFPPVDVKNFKLQRTKRVVMFNYDSAEDCVHMRHYYIDVKSGESSEEGKKKEKVNLRELGPRLTMQLRIVREGAMDGDLIFHKDSSLTPKEIEELRQQKAERKALKQQRKKVQEGNVEKKKKDKEQQKQEALEKKQANEEVLKEKWEKKLAKAGTEFEDDEEEDDGFEIAAHEEVPSDDEEEMEDDDE